MKNIRCECGKLHNIPQTLVRGRAPANEPLIIQCTCGHTITVPVAVLKGSFYGELTEEFVSQF